MKKVIVLGASGMLGQATFREFQRSSDFETLGTFSSNASSASPLSEPLVRAVFSPTNVDAELEKLLLKLDGCDYIINCVGLLKSEIDESKSSSVDQAMFVNGTFVQQLADFSLRNKIRLIHVSTDGVFAGTSTKPYTETDVVDASDVYGRSKILGEVDNGQTLTIRSSFIGLDRFKHRGLVEWFIAQPEGSELKGFTNHIWNGVTSLQFAQCCKALIQADLFDAALKEGPVHHLSPNSPLSKFELLEILKKAFKRNVSIQPVEAESGAVRRILKTQFHVLRGLCGSDINISRAVEELA